MVVADSARDFRGGVGGSATALTPDDESSPISAEFLGLARVAHRHFLGSVPVSPMMKSISSYAAAVYRTNKGKVPPRVVQQVERRWRALPLTGCVSQSIVLTGHMLRIRDVRATGSTLWMPAWGDDDGEPGICLVVCLLELHRKRLIGDSPIVASISMHGLARWFQRQASGEAATLDGLSADLAAIADAAPGLLTDRRIAAPLSIAGAGGEWHGFTAADSSGRWWANLRTFF